LIAPQPHIALFIVLKSSPPRDIVKSMLLALEGNILLLFRGNGGIDPQVRDPPRLLNKPSLIKVPADAQKHFLARSTQADQQRRFYVRHFLLSFGMRNANAQQSGKTYLTHSSYRTHGPYNGANETVC